MTSQSKKDTIKARLRLPLILCLFVVTVGLMTPDLCDFLSDATALQWTAVPAEITAVVAPITITLKDPYFDLRPEYKYSIDGKQYTGNRRSFYKNSPVLGYDLGVYLRSHPVGKKVTAMVEPGRPDNSVLEPEANWVSLLCRFSALAIFCCLIYLSTYPPLAKIT